MDKPKPQPRYLLEVRDRALIAVLLSSFARKSS